MESHIFENLVRGIFIGQEKDFMSSNFSLRAIDGQRWYPNRDDMLESLLRSNSPVELVVMRIWNGKSHLFSHFPDPYSFWKYYQKTAPAERCFNEIPMDTQVQKIRFDIDMENGTFAEADVLISGLIQANAAILNERMRTGRRFQLTTDVVVFTSHDLRRDSEDRTLVHPKLSYHIIIDNFGCISQIEFETLFELIITRTKFILGADWHALIDKYVDRGVAKSNHPLRMYGSIKPGTKRIKVWCPSWRFYNPDSQCWQMIQTTLPSEPIPELAILKASLISWTRHCRVVEVQPPTEIKQNRSWIDVELHEDIKDHVEDWLRGLGVDRLFMAGELQENRIPLIRIRSGTCPVCKRSHDNDNAYLMVTKSNNGTRVIFKCFRSPEESLTVCDDATRWVRSEESPPKPEEPLVRMQYMAIHELIDEKMAGGYGW